MSSTNELVFPADFKWSVATAGHQIEGDNIHSDWWAFEQIPGNIKNGDKSGKASFHMERVEEDISLMKELNVKSYRFSVEWSRIEPQEGQFDEKAISYYRREIELLKENGIEPMVTLHHFVHPQWFTASGGWHREDAAALFLRYAEKVEAAFGKDVDEWITFNEPMVLMLMGFGEGLFPPGEKAWNFWGPLKTILIAHAKTYRYYHAQAKNRGQSIKIGIAHHLRPLIGEGWLMKKLLPIPDFLLNWNILKALKTGELRGFVWKKFLGLRFPWPTKVILEEIKDTQDYIGINYYTREVIAFSSKLPFFVRKTLPGAETSDIDWSMDPEGFFITFKLIHEIYPQVPFYITENGLADENDRLRPDYILAHLREIHRAMTELPHKFVGYSHWSLMDNFEWAEGFWPRFGLIEVDYKNNGTRKMRPSAELIKQIYGSGRVPMSRLTSN